MKKILYTAILGNKDNICIPTYVNKDWEYLCFTDVIHTTSKSPWKFIKIPNSQDPIRDMKYYKMHPHKVLPPHDINIWMDGNFIIYKNLNEHKMVGDVNLFRHFERLCTYDEASVCKSMGLDDPQVIDKQMQTYESEGFPRRYNNSIYPECGRMLRKNTEQVKELMEFWYDQVKNGSKRDQLSFMYSSWKLKSNIHIYKEARDHSGFTWTPHLI